MQVFSRALLSASVCRYPVHKALYPKLRANCRSSSGMTHKMPNVHLLGVGSIGSLVAFHLEKVSKYNVVLLHRSPTSSLSSITLEDTHGKDAVSSFDQEAVDASNEPIDLLFVATKVQGTLDVLSRLKSRITQHSTLVFLQNGMGVDEELTKRLFTEANARPKMISTSLTIGAYLKAPAPDLHVFFAHPGAVLFALPPEAIESDYTLALEVMSSLPKINFKRLEWKEFKLAQIKKLIINMTINPTTALLQVKNGGCRNSDQVPLLWHAVVQEAHDVLSASLESDPHFDGRDLPDVEELLDMCLKSAKLYEANVSSMCADVINGSASTEIDYINGYISKLGREHAIPTPVNDTLIQLVKARTDTHSIMLAPLNV